MLEDDEEATSTTGAIFETAMSSDENSEKVGELGHEGDQEEVKPKGLGPIYLSTFLDILGVAIIIPILPYIVLESTSGDEFKLGILIALYSGAQVVGSIIMGYLSDRFGRRPVILASIMGSATGFLLLGFVILYATAEVRYGWLIAARLYAGLWGGSVPVSQAFIADVTTQKQRPKYLGLVGATIGTALTLGPGIGGGFLALFEGVGFEPFPARAAVFFTAFSFSFLGFLFSLFKLVEPVRVSDNSSDETELRSSVERTITAELETVDGFEAVKAIDKFRLGIVLLSVFSLNYAFNVMQSSYAVWIKDNLNWKESELAIMLVSSGVVIVIVQGAMIQPLIKRTGKHMLAVIGSICLGVGLVGYSVIVNIPLHVIVYLFHIFGFSIANTATIALVSRYASSETQGTAQGLSNAMNSLSRVAGPLFSLYLYGFSPLVFGEAAPKGVLPHAVGAGIVMLSSLPLLGLLYNSRKHKTNHDADSSVV